MLAGACFVSKLSSPSPEARVALSTRLSSKVRKVGGSLFEAYAAKLNIPAALDGYYARTKLHIHVCVKYQLAVHGTRN